VYFPSGEIASILARYQTPSSLKRASQVSPTFQPGTEGEKVPKEKAGRERAPPTFPPNPVAPKEGGAAREAWGEIWGAPGVFQKVGEED